MKAELYTAVIACIDAHVDNFLVQVRRASENVSTLATIGKIREFALFAPADDYYYQYRDYERLLQFLIRQHLTTSLIVDMLKLAGQDVQLPIAPVFDNRFLSLESIENRQLIQFIIVCNGKRVAYRYTSPLSDDVSKIRCTHHSDGIFVIDWADENQLSSHHRQVDGVIRVSLEQFMASFDFSQVYPIYLKKIRKAIHNANLEIGYKTIPTLSLRNLSRLKTSLIDSLNELNSQSLQFQKVNHKGEVVPFAGLSELPEEDLSIISKRIQEVGFPYLMTGSGSFATCFLTSEYMYSAIKNAHGVDYTAVVCGYIKAVEQLAYSLMKVTPLAGRTLFIKQNTKYISNDERLRRGCCQIGRVQPNGVRKQIWHVPVYPGNEFLYDTTLGPLVHFLNDNKDDWLISVPGQEYIFECLQNFAQYDRNGHFHRDNIDDTETVKRIRDNALLILYYLVGSYAPSFSLSTNEEKKERFCRMYRALQSIRSSVSNFYLQFEGGEQIKVIRLYDQPEPVYSEDGSLSESIIRFVPVDDFSTDVYGNVDRSKIQTDELLININNMPISIGFEQFSTHKVVPIVW